MFVPFLPYQHLPNFRASVLPPESDPVRGIRGSNPGAPGEFSPADGLDEIFVSSTNELKNEIATLQNTGRGAKIVLADGEYGAVMIECPIDDDDGDGTSGTRTEPICITAANPGGAIVEDLWRIGDHDIDIRDLTFHHQVRICAESERVTVAHCLFDKVDEHVDRTAIVVEDGAEQFTVSFNEIVKAKVIRKGEGLVKANHHDFIAVFCKRTTPSKGNYIGYNHLRCTRQSMVDEKIKSVAIRIGTNPGKNKQLNYVMGLTVEMNLIDYSGGSKRGTEQGIETKISGTEDAPLLIRNNLINGASVGINVRRQATDVDGTSVQCEANRTEGKGVNRYAGGDAGTKSTVNNDNAKGLHFFAGKPMAGEPNGHQYDAARNWSIHHVDGAMVILGFMFSPSDSDEPAGPIELGAEVNIPSQNSRNVNGTPNASFRSKVEHIPLSKDICGVGGHSVPR